MRQRTGAGALIMPADADVLACRVRLTLAAHGYPLALREDDLRVEAELRAKALSVACKRDVALLVSTQEQVRLWQRRLATTTAAPDPKGWPRDSICLHVQRWQEPLPGRFHEVHMVDAPGLSTCVIERLMQQSEHLCLHCFSPQPGSLHSSFHWDSEDALAVFLQGLLKTLSGSVLFGMGWEDYCLHRRQLGRRQGKIARGPGWRALLSGLLGQIGNPGDVTSAMVFLDGGKSFTLGQYVEVCQWMEETFSEQCLISVCVCTDQVLNHEVALLLAMPQERTW